MKKLTNLLLGSALCACALTSSAFAGLGHEIEKVTDKISDKVEEWTEEVPGHGLISKSLRFDNDAIKISKFKFVNGHKYISVVPGQEVEATFNYRINPDHFGIVHSIIAGFSCKHSDDIENAGPQVAILRTLEITESKGSSKVTFKAPVKEGVYQIRLVHTKTLTDTQAFEEWKQNESSDNIIGIVIVK